MTFKDHPLNAAASNKRPCGITGSCFSETAFQDETDLQLEFSELTEEGHDQGKKVNLAKTTSKFKGNLLKPLSREVE